MTSAHVGPLTLLDDLFNWIANRTAAQPGPGLFITTDVGELGMAIPTRHPANLVWAAEQLAAQKLVEYRADGTSNKMMLRMTHIGWQEHARRHREGSDEVRWSHFGHGP